MAPSSAYTRPPAIDSSPPITHATRIQAGARERPSDRGRRQEDPASDDEPENEEGRVPEIQAALQPAVWRGPLRERPESGLRARSRGGGKTENGAGLMPRSPARGRPRGRCARPARRSGRSSRRARPCDSRCCPRTRRGRVPPSRSRASPSPSAAARYRRRSRCCRPGTSGRSGRVRRRGPPAPEDEVEVGGRGQRPSEEHVPRREHAVVEDLPRAPGAMPNLFRPVEDGPDPWAASSLKTSSPKFRYPSVSVAMSGRSSSAADPLLDAHPHRAAGRDRG